MKQIFNTMIINKIKKLNSRTKELIDILKTDHIYLKVFCSTEKAKK